MPDTTHGAIPLDPALLDPVLRDASEARVDALRPGVWGLRLPLPYRLPRFVNCFLLARGDGWVLVDCGSGVDPGWAALERVLGELGIAPTEIDELVLTHLHADHGGLAAEIVARTGCRALRGDGPATSYDVLRDATIPLDDRRRRARAEGVPEDVLDLLVDGPLAGESIPEHVPADRVLAAGDVVATDGADWVVIDGQGHSPGQFALHDPASGWVIAADVVYPVPPYLEWGFTPDPVAEALASIERLEALAPERILPAHGAPDDEAAERLRSGRAAIRRMVDRHRDALRPDVARSGYEVACLLEGHDADPDARGSALSIALSTLEHLEGAGEAASRIDPADGVRRWTAAG